MRFALYRWVKPNMTIPEQPKLLTLGHMLTRITERQGGLPTRNWRLVPLEIEAKNCARDKCSHNSSSGTTCIRARVASPELSNLSKPSFRMPPSGQIMIWRLDQYDSCWWWCPNKRCCCCCWSWFWGKRWHSLVTATTGQQLGWSIFTTCWELRIVLLELGVSFLLPRCSYSGSYFVKSTQYSGPLCLSQSFRIWQMRPQLCTNTRSRQLFPQSTYRMEKFQQSNHQPAWFKRPNWKRSVWNAFKFCISADYIQSLWYLDRDENLLYFGSRGPSDYC